MAEAPPPKPRRPRPIAEVLDEIHGAPGGLAGELARLARAEKPVAVSCPRFRPQEAATNRSTFPEK